MTESWDGEVFSVPDISWQATPPPPRYPVPVRYVADLEVGDEVTIGVPGHYFIDGQMVALSDRDGADSAGQGAERRSVAVAAPFAYWLAKAFPRAGLTMQWWPLVHCWRYRDASTAGDGNGESGMPDGHPESWLDHVQSTLSEPPVRYARAAREARCLTGQRVRLQHDRGAWSWWITVGEAVEVHGDFVVHAMRPSDYWLAQAASEPVGKVHVFSLHRLYSYG